MEKNKIIMLTEGAVMLALASILSLLKIIDMPFGGSITAFSMLPVAVIAYRFGIWRGLLTGFAFSLLQLVMGIKTLTFATSAAAVIAIIALDYLLAFTVIGLSGIFRKKISGQGLSLAVGVFLVCALRYICHVISGCTVWAGVSIPSVGGLVFSLAYNASYMIPEAVITITAAYFAGQAFTLTKPEIKRVPLQKKEMINLYSLAPAIFGCVFSFVIIFSMTQTEDGFDISALTSAGASKWILVIAFFAAGILGAFLVRTVMNKLYKRHE